MSKKLKIKKNLPTNGFTIPRRAVWYVFRSLIVAMIVISLTFFVFLTAMSASNIYIIVTEGITLRAKCILGQSEKTEMEQYFTESCIKNDKAFENNLYEEYSITGMDYRLSVNGISVWPWNKTASMTVTERIPSITGSAYETAPSSSIPAWQDVQYKVICLKENNRWCITKVTVIKELKEETERATPNMSLTPITLKPEETATPMPTGGKSESVTESPT